MKNIRILSENFQFWVVKFSIYMYLNRRVFVMKSELSGDISLASNSFSLCCISCHNSRLLLCWISSWSFYQWDHDFLDCSESQQTERSRITQLHGSQRPLSSVSFYLSGRVYLCSRWKKSSEAIPVANQWPGVTLWSSPSLKDEKKIYFKRNE